MLQQIKVNGEHHQLGGVFSFDNAMRSYDTIRHISELLQMYHDILDKLLFLESNNPTYASELCMLQYVIREFMMSVKRMENKSNIYPILNN